MWSCSGCGDGEGECDGGDDQGVPIFLCDANLDGEVTKSDVNAPCALVKRKRARYPMVLPLAEANAWANYNDSGASANTIDINDFWQCYDVARGMLPKKYTAGAPD